MHSGLIIYDSLLLSNVEQIICLLPDVLFKPSFSFSALLCSLNFDRNFKSGRFTQLFGLCAYNYGTVHHNPTCITDNEYIYEIFKFVNGLFPMLKLNSCLINYYPDSNCFLPDHSDDEPSIAHDSFIVTISLGSKRKMCFKNIATGTLVCSVSLSDGQILIFSKNSQYYYTHGIPKVTNVNLADYSPRISATFRQLSC